MSQPHATERWDGPFHNVGVRRLGFGGIQLASSSSSTPPGCPWRRRLERTRGGDGPRCGSGTWRPLLGRARASRWRGGGRGFGEVDGHYRAVVAHQEERAAAALFLPGCGDDALLEEAGGVLDVLRLDLSERHAGVHDETSCFGAGKTSWPCLADALKDKRRGPTRWRARERIRGALGLPMLAPPAVEPAPDPSLLHWSQKEQRMMTSLGRARLSLGGQRAAGEQLSDCPQAHAGATRFCPRARCAARRCRDSVVRSPACSRHRIRTHFWGCRARAVRR